MFRIIVAFSAICVALAAIPHIEPGVWSFMVIVGVLICLGFLLELFAFEREPRDIPTDQEDI